MFWRQFRAVQAKNWTINKRAKQFLRENISVVILSIFIIVNEKTQENNLLTPFYLAIAIAGYSRTIAVWWLNEKETQQKELQKIMGLGQMSYVLSWMVYFIINGIMVTVVMMVITRFLVITDKTYFVTGYDFWSIALLYFLFAMSNIGFVLILCSFFSKAKSGSNAITFIQLIINFLYFLRFAKAVAQSKGLVMLLSIFPQLCFNMTLSRIAFIDQKDDVFQDKYFDITFSQGCWTLIITFLVYSLLALYLDQIIPNEMGTHKHPLFFLGVGSGDSAKNNRQRLLEEKEEAENESSAKYEQRVNREKPAIATLKNVDKSFGDKHVINDLTMKFYESEIFCLLGHNGAGKSTTINLLTGLLRPTSGNIQILGMKYPEDVDEIRKNIGLCLQYNVLYDEMTIEEHLRFYYRIKNEEDTHLEEEVNRIIEQCALITQRGKLSKNLSGGNKRKLCLANSLIGGSKLIFLDEPSSGLDPNSRQAIWGILKNIERDDKCIILTTHHLEQAEELSKRIAIMSKGRLIILGNREFITDKFSVGYHVVVTLNRSNPSSAKICKEIIGRNIVGSIEDKQAATNTLKFRFPLKALPYFSKTLKELESANVGSISVFMSNLEDAFIKIGEQEENFNEGFQELDFNQIQGGKYDQVEQLDNQLALPEVECVYSFGSQMKAVFWRKLRTTLRSFSTVVSVIMPAAFMSIGILVACLAFDLDDEDDPVNKVILARVRLQVMSYIMTWAFVFNTSSYCGGIVQQREKKFKYISNVHGLRQLPYWAGNYAFDLIIFYIPLILFFIICFALGSKSSFITDHIGQVIAVLFLFGFSFIGYSYLWSFIFQKSTTAYRFFPFMNLIFFYFLPLLPFILDASGILAQYVMPMLSPFVAFFSFFNTKEMVGSDEGQTLAYNKLIVCYAALAIQAMVYFIVCLMLENLRFSLKSSNQELVHHDNIGAAEQPGDEIQQYADVEARRSYEQRGGNKPILVDKLTKIYGNGYVAIRENSFTVRGGEIFGLLGPNGAGKSTTFNIITAALPKTSGSVQLFNQEVNRGIMEIFEHVGVCPQYNPIYQNMTVHQHLEYFCRLKGIPDDKAESTINFYIDLLSLSPYTKVKAGVLSGGNKRKMCVGMAMIGNPNVVFFDEPSAGVDPISRRYLWKCLAFSAKSRETAMVLTTHSMNEAESLCSYIGILIKGQFVCLDTPKKLKQRFGKGYRINVLAPVQNHEGLIKLMREEYGQAVSFEKIEGGDPEMIVFVIKNENFCLSRAFEIFEDKLSQEGRVNRYEIMESTLEQVFIHLSRLQPVVEEQAYAEPWQLLCWQWGANGCNLAV